MNNLISKNRILKNQSAGNSNGGTSETLREKSLKQQQIPRYIEESKLDYIAGVIDGDGNFDVRNSSSGEKTRILRSIRVLMSIRDVEVLYELKKILKCGVLKSNTNLVNYHISTQVNMKALIEHLNGRIRLKVSGFKEACESYGIEYKPADYVIKKNSNYLAGLIDTDGSIVFSYSRNVIMLSLEFKYNDYSSNLDFSETIEGCKPITIKLTKKNQSKGKVFHSIRFAWQDVSGMNSLYEFARKCKLHSRLKFYRCMQIKPFMKIRSFKTAEKHSYPHQVYSLWVIRFIRYMNPSYKNVKYYSELS